jgi:uncharacterized membrane protein
MGWTEYALAFAAFFLTHSLPVRPPLRPWLVGRLGPRGFGLAYSALSLAVLVWLIGAAGRAPLVPLWTWAPWQHYVTLLAMLPVCLILALAIARPNLFSFGGARNADFDASRPGIVRLTRHPLLLALAIWALAHILPNGDLAHAILFGTFALFALFGGRLIDMRKQHMMGAEEWARLDRLRQAALVFTRPRSWLGLGLRLLVGASLYATLFWVHPWLIGVRPLP